MPPREPEVADDAALLRLFLEFGDAVGRATAERVQEVEGGHAVLTPSADLLHDASYLAIEDIGRSAADLAKLASEVMERNGLSAFTVAPLDPVESASLEPGFRELGWKVERGVYMVHRRPPDRPPDRPVTELEGPPPGDSFRDLMKEVWAPDYSGDPDEVADQFAARERAYAAFGGDRWFVAEHDGAPAACCYLIEREGLGQVESVATATQARNRGLARAVVLAAVEASRRSGNELTFIGAEEDDWPQELYQRLGFDPVGIETTFVKGAPNPRRPPS